MEMINGDMLTEAKRKEERLFTWLGQQDAVAVAFSGGVDSVYLSWAAAKAVKNNENCCDYL